MLDLTKHKHILYRPAYRQHFSTTNACVLFAFLEDLDTKVPINTTRYIKFGWLMEELGFLPIELELALNVVCRRALSQKHLEQMCEPGDAILPYAYYWKDHEYGWHNSLLRFKRNDEAVRKMMDELCVEEEN